MPIMHFCPNTLARIMNVQEIMLRFFMAIAEQITGGAVVIMVGVMRHDVIILHLINRAALTGTFCYHKIISFSRGGQEE